MAKPLQRPGLNKAKAALPIISPIEEVLNQLPSPLTAFTLLDLDVSLIITYKLTPVGGRLLLFIHNWEILIKDPWVLTTVREHHLPLCQEAVLVTFMLDSEKEEALAEEISNLAVTSVKKHQAHLISPLFVVPKNGGEWQPITDLQQLNQCMDPPHTCIKMEGLHKLLSFHPCVNWR